MRFPKIRGERAKHVRDYLHRLEAEGRLTRIAEPISQKYEIAVVLKVLEPRPAIFENVVESEYPVVGNLFCSKADFADYFGVSVAEIISMLRRAIDGPLPPTPLPQGEGSALCQEVVHLNPDLDMLPIPLHFEGDGGPYITAGVFVAGHPQYG